MLPSDPVTERTIRVGFVGAGKNTRSRHIPGFLKLPGVELVAVANRSRESGERVAREFGIARVEADWRDLVRAGDVDAVCIGTWPYMHSVMSIAALVPRGSGARPVHESRDRSAAGGPSPPAG